MRGFPPLCQLKRAKNQPTMNGYGEQSVILGGFMKYQPPVWEELSEDQRTLYEIIQRKEDEEEARLQQDPQFHQQAVEYHQELTQLVKERAGGRVAAIIKGPVSSDDIKAALDLMEASKGLLPPDGLNISPGYAESAAKRERERSTVAQVSVERLAPVKSRPIQRPKRPRTKLYEAVHAAAAAASGKKKTHKG